MNRAYRCDRHRRFLLPMSQRCSTLKLSVENLPSKELIAVKRPIQKDSSIESQPPRFTKVLKTSLALLWGAKYTRDKDPKKSQNMNDEHERLDSGKNSRKISIEEYRNSYDNVKR